MKLRLPDPALIKKLDFKNPATWVATWFGCGLMSPAPGTWGTLGGIPVGLIILTLGGKLALVLSILAIIPIGLWSAKKFQEMTGVHDSSIIVIDEVAGIWITLLATTLAPLSIILAFILFRAFDILKPWPVSWLDRNLGGPWGVMLDDLAAGILAGLCLWGLNTYAFAG